MRFDRVADMRDLDRRVLALLSHELKQEAREAHSTDRKEAK